MFTYKYAHLCVGICLFAFEYMNLYTKSNFQSEYPIITSHYQALWRLASWNARKRVDKCQIIHNYNDANNDDDNNSSSSNNSENKNNTI